MILKAYSYSNQGGKENNEDSIDYKINEDKADFILADGLGGHRNGEVASGMVVENLMYRLQQAETVNHEFISRSIIEVNELLLEMQKNPDFGVMKTTAVVLHIADNKAIWGHIGDSRLYYLHGNQINSITKDHSVTYKKFASGEISEREMNQDEDRTSLLGVMGNKDKCLPEVLNEPLPLSRGDAFLLCSDGFWEYLYREEILIDFLKASTPKEWAEFMLLRHIGRQEPGNDNFTLITVFVE